MAELLADNPFLLLFLVAALGFLAGRVRVLGFRLGVAAVLFVGLGFGALGPDVRLPDFVYLFGLVLFVYTVGLAGGPGFVAALRRRGLRDNSLALAVLVLGGIAVAVAAAAADLDGAQASGLFAGSLTNTPALAAVLDYLGDAGGVDLTVPVIAYSVTYPMGVLGVILAISILQRLWRVDYAAEAHALRDEAVTGERIDDVSVVVTNPEVLGRTVEDLVRTATPRVVYGRILRSGQPQDVVGADTRLAAGDVVTIIGTADHVAAAVGALGHVAEDPLVFDREDLDIRRIFVSSNDVVGRTIGELELPYRFGAIATRVRRGDVDVLASADLRLLPGDRVRVLAPRERLSEITRYFGDSYRLLSEFDVGVFGLGIALGLLVGLVPIPLPGGGTFELGLAGGPLLVGLALGAMVRTGPLVWQLPYNANLTLRQLGVILFLAGVGTRSGWTFASAVGDDGVLLFLVGAAVTCLVAVVLLTVGHRVLRIPMSLLLGMTAGVHTQPAVLAYATEQTGNEIPNLGYAAVFPVATVAKILIAQTLVSWL